jgi:hypothetical protein
MLVMINARKGIKDAKKSSEQAKRTCLVSVAEREHAPADKSSAGQTSVRPPNFFSLGQEEVGNAFVNEFVAPFQGLEKVREAHGNWAAAELALEVCAEFTEAELAQLASEPSQMQIAAVHDNSAGVSVDETEPVDITRNPDRPYFAHLAMCKDQKKDDKTAPIQPPLGWVLSKWTQKHFGDLLTSCENEKQLPQLETALRGKPAQNAGPEVGVLK